MPPIRSLLVALSLLSLLALGACSREPDVTVYVALDQVFSEPLIRRFEAESGLTVRAEYDIEANKTVGLVRRIREEHNRPRCDVFWNNEIAHTVGLANDGLLVSYDSPSAAGIPATFRDPEHRWTGFAARARVFIVNTDLVEDPSVIHGMWDLVDERWHGKVGMARPLTGTTLTHMTALFSVLGEEEANRYLAAIKQLSEEGKVNLTSGNAHVMRLVSAGELAWGWTDTDDFNVALERGAPVVAVYPDAAPNNDGEDALGTLLIPNTIAILKTAPHMDNARTFVDWVLRPEVEAELARARSAQIPVRADVARPEHVRGPDQFRVMEVDFLTVGSEIGQRAEELKARFLD